MLGPRWTGPCPEVMVSAGGLKAACLLMGVAVSTQVVSWPESSQHWQLSAVGEGEQVLVQVS